MDFFLKRVFGSKNERELRRMAPLVDRITMLEPEYRQLSDAQLQAKTPHFRERLDRGEPLEDLLPEAFAAVREASTRVLGMRRLNLRRRMGAAGSSILLATTKRGFPSRDRLYTASSARRFL